MEIKVTDLSSSQKKKIYTKFVFIGAGGGSFTLLEKQMFQREKDMVVFL
jgi:L-2-hydroxyglutarate oxidase LhgO